MPYASLADVQARMPQFSLTAISKPALNDAQIYLDAKASEVDGALVNLGYVIPITGEQAVSWVRETVCFGTIAMVLYARSAGVGGDQALLTADRMQKLFADRLAALADPYNKTVELVDAERTDDRDEKPDTVLAGSTRDDNGCLLQPHMTFDMKF